MSVPHSDVLHRSARTKALFVIRFGDTCYAANEVVWSGVTIGRWTEHLTNPYHAASIVALAEQQAACLVLEIASSLRTSYPANDVFPGAGGDTYFVSTVRIVKDTVPFPREGRKSELAVRQLSMGLGDGVSGSHIPLINAKIIDGQIQKRSSQGECVSGGTYERAFGAPRFGLENGMSR